jgi:hypothetical protein
LSPSPVTDKDHRPNPKRRRVPPRSSQPRSPRSSHREAFAHKILLQNAFRSWSSKSCDSSYGKQQSLPKRRYTLRRGSSCRNLFPNRSLIKERFEDAILKRTVKQRRRRAGKRGYHPTPIGVSRSPFTGLQALLFQPNFGLASQRLPIRWRLMERQSSVKTVIHGSCVRQKDGVPTASRCCHEHAPIFRDKTKSSILETGCHCAWQARSKSPGGFPRAISRINDAP